MRKMYERYGYVVIRSAGSLGAADLIAWNEDSVHLIQCKKETRKDSYNRDMVRLRAVKVPRIGKWEKVLWIKRRYGDTVEMRTLSADGYDKVMVPYERVRG